MPIHVELLLRIGGLLSTLAAGAFGWVYWRRLAVDAAQTRLDRINAQTIASLESGMRLAERKLELALAGTADCERELEQTKDALAEWETMLGQIWIRDDGDPAR